MADRARSAFITLKSKRQRTEDEEDDFHFVNKRFKGEGDLDNITHFRLMLPFYTPWKCKKTRGFLTFPGGYRKGTLAWNGLNTATLLKKALFANF